MVLRLYNSICKLHSGTFRWGLSLQERAPCHLPVPARAQPAALLMACLTPLALPSSCLRFPRLTRSQARQHPTLWVLQLRGGLDGQGNSPWWGIPGGEVTRPRGTFIMAHRVALPSSRGQGEYSALTSPGSPRWELVQLSGRQAAQ